VKVTLGLLTGLAGEKLKAAMTPNGRIRQDEQQSGRGDGQAMEKRDGACQSASSLRRRAPPAPPRGARFVQFAVRADHHTIVAHRSLRRDVAFGKIARNCGKAAAHRPSRSRIRRETDLDDLLIVVVETSCPVPQSRTTAPEASRTTPRAERPGLPPNSPALRADAFRINRGECRQTIGVELAHADALAKTAPMAAGPPESGT